MREDLARSFRGQLQQEMSYIVSGIGQVIKEGKEATIDTGALRELLVMLSCRGREKEWRVLNHAEAN